MDHSATNPPRFSLVLPAYNAAGLLDATWRAVERFIAQGRGRWEAVYVCDGCTDGSDFALQRRAAATDLPIRVVRYARNRGKGYAVRLGLRRATGQYRVFTDVDLAYRLDQVQRVAAELAHGHDVVIASRAVAGSEVLHDAQLNSYMQRRRVQSLVFRRLTRTILGLRFRDTQAGLKGLSAHAAQLLLPHVKCTGFGFDCDLLSACRHFGLAVREVPVRVFYDSAGSTTGLTSSVKMVKELWAIRRRWEALGPPPKAARRRAASASDSARPAGLPDAAFEART